jgi:hypothetical protein
LPVCGIVYNNRRGLQLGQLIEQGSSSRGPGGGGFQLGEPLQHRVRPRAVRDVPSRSAAACSWAAASAGTFSGRGAIARPGRR